MKVIVFYPEGHEQEGEIPAVFHEMTVEEVPSQYDENGDELPVLEVPNDVLPDDPDLNAWRIDLAEQEIVQEE